MLDACPHHHEEPKDALDGVQLRNPSASQPKSGPKVWRSLDELTRTKSFETMLHREFPHMASEWSDGPSRRNFLKLMSASLALAGLTACTLRKPEEKIVPYVEAPEDVIPGRPLFYASTMPFAGYGKGVIVESHEGRPTKIEGNTDHPASLGASDIWMQASVLDLYDPDRSQIVMHGNSPSSWGNFVSTMGPELQTAAANGGKGMRILTGATSSPTFIRQMKDLQAKFPQAKWHVHEPAGRGNAAAGAKLAFGQDVEAVYSFDKADVIVSLDNNFLMDSPGSLAYARQFAKGRRVRKGDGESKMNRLYVAEVGLTIVGAQADHRLAIKAGDIQSLTADLAAAVAGQSVGGKNAKWVTAVAKDLKASAGKSLVVVGEGQPAVVHALVAKINADLGNVGKTVSYIDPVVATAGSLEDLVTDINAGAVDMLFILGTNPCFTAAHSLGLFEGTDPKLNDADRAAAYKNKNPLSKVRMVVHHGMYNGVFDETAVFAHWHIPASHYLEAWGDARAFDGTPSIIQPLIYPLYVSKTEIELLALLNGEGLGGLAARSGHDIVHETWTKVVANLSEDDWQRTLEKGVVFHAASAIAKNLPVKDFAVPAAPAESKIELVFKTDPSIYDGRYANNGWLQEVPKPISLVTWENVALMSVGTAANLQISQADQGRGLEVPVLKITVNGTEMKIPAMIMPGHADDSITVYLGYGHARGGRVAMNGVHIGYLEGETDANEETGRVGSDAYALKPATNVWFVSNIDQPVVTDVKAKVATSQSHHLMDIPKEDQAKLDKYWLGEEGSPVDRELIHTFKLEEVNAARKTGEIAEGPRKVHLPLAVEPLRDDEKLLPSWNYDYNKWGMVIDNQACVGCNSCVIACQSENNIAIVGKEEVLRGREMHWIRIDTYFIGEPDGSVEVFNQPIPCMQCENAPCALVCPVEATSTSAEGINEQTYNRCVGTRYCSNNCPYKVRRFNFLQYTDYETPQFMLQRNPNVTVRARGVMEKCNFCVQRVNNARIEAKKQDRPIMEGEVKTACQQSCPTEAISFGNLNDKNQLVTRLQEEPLRYTLLDELNALPRVSYMARVKNLNPELVSV
jgi:molybdopterin-containing oxidoreductase family iron-sulfur binding subunit